MSASTCQLRCYRYRGVIASRPVSGSIELPDMSYTLEAALRLLFKRLRAETGLPIAKMETNASVLWTTTSEKV